MTYTNALRTSSCGITPSFSSGNSSCGAEKRWKASLISFSSSAEMSFSRASLDARDFLGAVDDVARFLGGCHDQSVLLLWYYMV